MNSQMRKDLERSGRVPNTGTSVLWRWVYNIPSMWMCSLAQKLL